MERIDYCWAACFLMGMYFIFAGDSATASAFVVGAVVILALDYRE